MLERGCQGGQRCLELRVTAVPHVGGCPVHHLVRLHAHAVQLAAGGALQTEDGHLERRAIGQGEDPSRGNLAGSTHPDDSARVVVLDGRGEELAH